MSDMAPALNEDDVPSARATRIAAHVANAVELARCDDDPFSHCYISGVFPDDVYIQIAAMLPAPERYHQYFHKDANRADGTSTREAFPLDTQRLDQLEGFPQQFWWDIAIALQSERVKAAVFRKLATDLSIRFKFERHDVASIRSYPHISLLRDALGYKISIHPDTRLKIVTFQAYLPFDTTQQALGTSIYRDRRKLTSTADEERFQLVRTFDFLPNAAYAFAVSHKSWHGRDEITENSKPRNSLQLIYYIEPGHGY